MSITKTKSTIVVPSKETPRTTLWLSDVDLIRKSPFGHASHVYIYPNPNNDNSTQTFPKQVDSALLISSLSEVLVAFYPIAGRLRENAETGRLEVDCNAKGALFVEVETTYNISDFGEFTPSETLENLVMPSCNYADGLANMPLIMLQLTRFRCGGVAVCVAGHHYVMDATAVVYLMNQWARLARGAGLTALPNFDRTKVLVARDPPQVKFDHLEFQGAPLPSSDSQPIEETKVELFKFSQDQISSLKRQAMPTSHGTKYSTFEVLAAHLWRCVLKARGAENDKVVKFATLVNGRTKFKEVLLQQGYFGNFIFKSEYVVKSGDILSRPLWYATSKVREATSRVDEEYIKSHIDFLSKLSNLKALAVGPRVSGGPNIFVNSWRGIPFFEADFGWGKPAYVRRTSIPGEGQITILPSEKDDYLFVAINLFSSHMDHFKQIIYDFDDNSTTL